MVARDSLPVYSANSPKSDIVRTLSKGDVVWIQMEITGSEDKWCLISEKEKNENLGFVFCKDLEYLQKSLKENRPAPSGQDISRPFTEKPGIHSPDDSSYRIVNPPAVDFGSLLQAVWKEDIDEVKDLLGKGTNLNAQTRLGTSPLHVSAKKEATEITSLLILHGADVNARDGTGMTPLMAAASAGQIQNLEILLAAGADINAQDNQGFTALRWAVFQGFPDGVEFLLENNAAINIKSNQGTTALWHSKQILANTRKSLASAFRKNSEETIKELRLKLARHEEVFRLLQDAGGKE